MTELFGTQLRRRLSAGMLCCALLLAGSAMAQESFRARLSPMPTTPQTKDTITGGGEAIATLAGKVLSFSGDFAGMSSTATMAHVHQGPPAQPGPVVAALVVAEETAGSLSGSIELNDEQLAALRRHSLYVQIHSASNPAGELRGWLFAR